MSSLLSSQPGPRTDVALLNKFQKLAALLIILGPESAAKILVNLGELEVEAISAEMSRMPTIAPEFRDEILQDFGEVAMREVALSASLKTHGLGETSQKEEDEALV